MTLERTLRLFYLFLAVVLFSNIFLYWNFISSSPLAVFWLKSVLGTESTQSQIVFLMASLLGIISSLVLFFRPQAFSPKLAVFLALFILIPLYFISTGRLFHKYHTTLYALFFCLFFTFNHKSQKRNAQVLWWLQSTLLLPYAISGFWKIHALIQASDDNPVFENTGRLATHSIMYNSISTGIRPPPLGNWILALPPTLTSILGLSLLAFELSCLIPIFSGKFMRMWGIMAFVFHLASFLAMDISFFPANVVVLIFMVLPKQRQIFRD